MEDKKKVVVIGGGITGLTTAYYLQKTIQKEQMSCDVSLVEASHKLGGKFQTVYKDGFTIERGPDSFLERKMSAQELAIEVGLKDELVNNTAGRAFVLANEKLHPMPKGAVMGIPTKIGPFITTDLFTIQGKMRAAADLVMPRSNVSGDQSLGRFFRRRLGDEVVENLVEPLLSGIYAGDIDRLSLMSTFPQFYHAEQKYRSLILGMKKTTPSAPPKTVSAKNQGIFLTLKGGLESLVKAIEEKLETDSIIKGTRVVSITENDGNGYKLMLNNGDSLDADSVVIALPHFALADLFPDDSVIQELKDMPATSVATVAMAFNAEDVDDHLDGTGFVVSRNSDYTITACTWTHKKWPHTTPEGKVLLRCYVGRAGEETVVDLSDEEIEKIVLADLKRTMNLTAKPNFTIVSRWKQSMPQYTVGHKERIDKIKSNFKEIMPGVFIAGSSYEGLGIPDCIDQGKAAVEEVLQYIS
ncbi:protoporphyrinogen oxidase [Siminovitchia acidinfaciens]|uniref:Coproporphyrinogen III oxidase n=1 Tax=Siminovitchia acidinfaciens TaxID=2321395 RepID=A0A429Y1T1_9BACI|nr:protoporphyrinogen oxidase [Siminovitchia acidinfaciens]RST75178.1 protoporphyrinogen oxidase [Siminovitchia acidinfaciens]